MEPYARLSKDDIENILLEISSLLKDSEKLAACDQWAGPGATEKMYRDREKILAQRYAELLDAEYGFPIQKYKQETVMPTWQHNYDLR